MLKPPSLQVRSLGVAAQPDRLHRERVLAVTTMLVSKLDWSPQAKRLLAETTGAYTGGETSRVWVERLLGDLQLAPQQPDAIAVACRQEIDRLIELTEMFVVRWESSPYDPVSFPDIVQELRSVSRRDLVDALARVPSVTLPEVREVVSRLPVFPAVAMKVLRLSANPDAGGADIEAAVRSDPVLAGELLKAANSPLMSPASPIRTIRHAVGFMGVRTCCRVVAAAALRPMFVNPLVKSLWKHSVDVAVYMEQLAQQTGAAPAEEAFLAGLLHDVGRLALWRLPRARLSVYQELLERGCESTFAEVLLCGFDHTVAGAEVTRCWRLQPDLIEAIQFHHQPEATTSRLSHLLYLAEHFSDSEEDLPSLARLHTAASSVGVAIGELQKIRRPVSVID